MFCFSNNDGDREAKKKKVSRWEALQLFISSLTSTQNMFAHSREKIFYLLLHI